MFEQFLMVATSQETSLGDINTALLALAESQVVQGRQLESRLVTDIASTIARMLDGQMDRIDALLEIDDLTHQYIEAVR